MAALSEIHVQWDTQDPANHGWAWYSYGVDEELYDSGPLDGRRDCGDKTLRRRARAAAGGDRSTPVKVFR